MLLIAEGAAGVRMLRALNGLEHRLVAVMTREANGAGTGVTVAALARSLGYMVWDAALATDAAFADTVSACEVDILLNVHSLAIVDAAVLRATRYGGYNLHPGPLPRYAGLNSVSWALYRGEQTHGVTIHRMEAAIDAGAIAYQESFPIAPTDTALAVTTRCVTVGLRLMLRLLETASTAPSRIPAHEQDLSQRECFGREAPERGQLTWAQPAARVVDFVRACDYYPLSSPWGHPRTRAGTRELGVVKASRTGVATDVPPGTVGDVTGPSVRVACRDEWISIAKVLVDGRNVDAVDALLSGVRLQDERSHRA